MILETKSHSLKVTLTEDNGKIILKTDIFPYLKYFRDSIITSDILGCAFEPNQRFENPDGSAIVFDEDYFGLRRELSTLPGPFAEAHKEVIVWNHNGGIAS